MNTVQTAAVIKVIGVGGGGGNTVNHMVRTGTEGAEFILINTDSQHLAASLVPPENRIQIGDGLGAGAQPEVARAEAEKAAEMIAQRIGSADLIFIAAGMGGGTGTGAAPVIAKTVRSLPSSSPGKSPLVVGVTTLPFAFEGAEKMRIALKGLEEFREQCDAYIVIPNQSLMKLAPRAGRMTVRQAFAMVDDVLRNAVHGLVSMITHAGEVNLDMADVRTTLQDAGECLFGMGIYTPGQGGSVSDESPLVQATRAAIESPLLDIDIRGATRVLLNFVGRTEDDLDLVQLNEAAEMVSRQVDPDAKLIWGLGYDPTLPEHGVRVNVIVGGLRSASAARAGDAAQSEQSVLAKVAAARDSDIITTVRSSDAAPQTERRRRFTLPSFLENVRIDWRS